MTPKSELGALVKLLELQIVVREDSGYNESSYTLGFNLSGALRAALSLDIF